MSTSTEGDEEAHGALPDAPRTKRTLLSVAVAAGAVAAAAFLAWAARHEPNPIASPLLWAGVAAFWAAAFCAVFALEIGAVERALARAGALEVTGVRVFWLPKPDSRMVGASMEVRARSRDEAFPPEFSLYLNLDLAWSLHVLSLRAAWQCQEDGVVLLTPHAPRFLGGATAESLDLPSQEVAALKGLLRPPGEPEGLPAWGAPAGPLARRALADSNAAGWLLGPEQPFVAFEAFGGRIEKTWPPVAERLVSLDVEGALDVLRILRAFDRDVLDARRARLTSSPSSPRP